MTLLNNSIFSWILQPSFTEQSKSAFRMEKISTPIMEELQDSDEAQCPDFCRNSNTFTFHNSSSNCP